MFLVELLRPAVVHPHDHRNSHLKAIPQQSQLNIQTPKSSYQELTRPPHSCQLAHLVSSLPSLELIVKPLALTIQPSFDKSSVTSSVELSNLPRHRRHLRDNVYFRVSRFDMFCTGMYGANRSVHARPISVQYTHIPRLPSSARNSVTSEPASPLDVLRPSGSRFFLVEAEDHVEVRSPKPRYPILPYQTQLSGSLGRVACHHR